MRALDRWSGGPFRGRIVCRVGVPRRDLASFHHKRFPRLRRSQGQRSSRSRPGDFNEPVLTTLRQVVVGYAVAVVIAIPCGLALGRWAWAHAAFEPLIEFLRPMPVAGILPVVLFFLGYHDATAYAVIAFGAGWIVLTPCHGWNSRRRSRPRRYGRASFASRRRECSAGSSFRRLCRTFSPGSALLWASP